MRTTKLRTRSASDAILRLSNISKHYTNKAVLSKIDFSAYPGEIVGIYGPNGAGKTSLLHVCMGLLTPDRGTVSIFSKSYKDNRQWILQKINFASSSTRLSGYASVKENLQTFASLYQIQNPSEKIQALSHNLGITSLLSSNSKVYKLSTGENTKVNLCKALLNNPDILFLDEITAHLDQEGIKQIFTYLKQENQQRNLTVLFVSHNASHLHEICTRIVYMDNGKIYHKPAQKNLPSRI